jgi:hypothetical protein
MQNGATVAWFEMTANALMGAPVAPQFIFFFPMAFSQGHLNYDYQE